MEKFVPTFDEINETIKKTGRKTWTVYSEKGRRLGSAGSMSAARRRLKQVEAFKHMNESEFTPEYIQRIADESGLDISGYDMNEIMLGMPVQLEHGTQAGENDITGDDPVETLKIVLAHLKEFEKYYSRVLIPAQEAAGISEARFDNQFVLKSADGRGYFSMDSTTKQPRFGTSIENAYTYSMEEAEMIRDSMKEQLQEEVQIVPYNSEMQNAGLMESGEFALTVPMFEDYTNDNFKMSDWYIGYTGDLYASDGRAVRTFDYEAPENQPTEEENALLGPYEDVVRGAYKLFNNITEPHKGEDFIAFGFAGPAIKNGPYAGSDSWWTFGYYVKEKAFVLINDVSGQVYEVSDITDFRKLLSELVRDLYENINENEQECPACDKPRIASCKCAGFVKHDFDAVMRGHGMMCENKHRWSNQTADGKTIIIL